MSCGAARHPLLEDAHPLAPAIILRINENLIWKRIRLVRSDGRDVIPVPVDDVYDLHGCSLQRHLHSSACFDCFCDHWSAHDSAVLLPNQFRTGLVSGCCECHIQDPILPHHLFIRLCSEPALLPLLLHELYNDLSSTPFKTLILGGSRTELRRSACGDVELADEGTSALLDQSFEVHVGHLRKGHI